MNRRLRGVAGAVLGALAGACASQAPWPPPPAAASAADVCHALFAAVDARVEEAGVGDAQYARIEGFPYLRIDRFLADPAARPAATGDAFPVWVRALRARDAEARRVELRNLSRAARASLGQRPAQRLDACAAVLVEKELASEADRGRLLAVARVPDDYSVAKRVLGLYPFTSLPFNAGVEDLHDSMRAAFAAPLEALAVEGRLTRFVPPPAGRAANPSSVAALLEDLRLGAARLPATSDAVVADLFDAFAPVYEIDVVTDDDRIGTPYWSEDGLPSVDVGRPVVFRRLAVTRFGGRPLVQLVYSVWFPSRPAQGDFDLLSGRLDGITFRVTVTEDGRPLLYDSMHNCGCYHLFLPTTRLAAKPPGRAHEEPPLIAQWIPPRIARPVLRIASRTHYLQRLYFDPPPQEGTVYAFRDDDALRSLVFADGERRSLFGPDGIVPGTERAERWLFWPMGIAEPGAMRQWGRHATAFVGTRHFDDPGLVERYFEPAE